MSVITFTEEISSPLPAKRVFNTCLDYQNLYPKVAPQFLKNVEVISGDGGPGSTKKLNFHEASELKPILEKTDAVDKENLIYNSTITGVESIIENVESISCETKFLASPAGGCKAVNVTKYYPKPGVSINKDKIKEHREKFMKKSSDAFKVVEGYLLANPTVCA